MSVDKLAKLSLQWDQILMSECHNEIFFLQEVQPEGTKSLMKEQLSK